MFLTCPSGGLSGKIEADFISEGLGWVTAPQSEALFGKNWQKNCRISETKRFDPLKSNSPLYKPHQMGPFQERNFFFFCDQKKKLTLPLFRCRDSQRRDHLDQYLVLLYHFIHRAKYFWAQERCRSEQVGKSITSLITSVTRMAMAMACRALMTTKSKSGRNSLILVSKGIYCYQHLKVPCSGMPFFRQKKPTKQNKLKQN